MQPFGDSLDRAIDHALQLGSVLRCSGFAQTALGPARRKPGRIAVDLQRSFQLQHPAKIGLDGGLARAGAPERIALMVQISSERR